MKTGKEQRNNCWIVEEKQVFFCSSRTVSRSFFRDCLRGFWRHLLSFVERAFHCFDGENRKRKIFRRYAIFFQNLFLRGFRTSSSSTVELETKIFPRSKLSYHELGFEYNMNHDHRGIAMIFNHEHFHNEKRRTGTNLDSQRLQESLKRFGFDVRVFDDLSSDEIEDELCKSKRLSVLISLFVMILFSFRTRSQQKRLHSYGNNDTRWFRDCCKL